MFSKIMVPVDLRHLDKIEKALTVASDLANQYSASVTYVAVTSSAPGPLGHTPEEFGEKLAAFAEEQGKAKGHGAQSKAIVSNDPSVELDKALLDEVKAEGADLVVMASHIPNLTDYIWSSHGGHLASHADCSVMIVRQ